MSSKFRNSKKLKHRNSRKKRSRRNKKTPRNYKSGGCGCGQKFMGGSAYLSNVPQYAYYPYQSDIQNDPQNPANVGNGRTMGDYSRGGGRKTRRSRGKKTRGGSNFFSNLYTQLANSGSGMNYINSFGAANGGINQSTLITGTNVVVNGSVTSQPAIEQPYGFQNPPLV